MERFRGDSLMNDLKLKSVYFLWQKNIDNERDEDDKLLGVYSSKVIAQKRIKIKYRKLPGFKNKNGEFIIDKYQSDKDHWEVGFITVDRKK
jgi:hypothetical protein